MRIVVTIVLVALAAVPVATAADPAPIQISNFQFQPGQIRVPLGATVTWKNTAGTAHTVTADAGGFDSGRLQQDANFSFRFASEGVYDYHCAIHASMRGQIVVGAGAGVEKPENPGGGGGY